MSMEKLKYSKEIGNKASIVVIDEEVVKNRNLEDVDKAIKNLENVVVQNGDKIDICCKSEIRINNCNKILNFLKDKGVDVKNINIHKEWFCIRSIFN